MDPPSFTRKILKEDLMISENQLDRYQKILAEKAAKITKKLRLEQGYDSDEEEDQSGVDGKESESHQNETQANKSL